MKLQTILGLLLLSLTASAQWQVRMGGLPPSDFFYTVTLADSTTAWVGANSELWLSTDVGRSWSPVLIAAQYGPPVILNAVCRNCLIYGTSRGIIVRSTDRGASWQKVFNDSTVTPFINDLVMFDSLNGCAIGDPPDATRRPGILKTTDGGSTWQVVINDLPVGDYQSRGRTAFLRPDLAWSKGFNDGIYKSTDGCQTWKRIYPELIPHLLFFLNDSVGFFTSVNSPPGLYKSTDGGATWMRKFYGQDFFWIKWAPGGKVLWAGNDSLFISTNAGESWQPALSNRGQGGCGSFSDAAFLTDDVGLVVGMCLVLGMSQDPDFVPLPQEGDVPHLALQQNYPNPFNPSTTIRYELPYASRVTLTLYNLLGQEVMTLVDGHKPAGMYDVQLNAGSLPSGMYLYRLHAANYFAAKRLLLLK